MVSEAEIIGKSHFKLSHSTPQVRSYPKDEVEAKKASTFAPFLGVENTIYIYRYEDKIKPVYIVHSFIEQYVFSIH